MDIYNMTGTDRKNELEVKETYNIVRYREGVLYADRRTKERPLYIIRQVEQGNGTWAFVYNVSEEDFKLSKGKVVRKRYAKKIIKRTFGETFLGRMAQNSKLGEDKQIIQELPHVFLSPVIEGYSTLSGRKGQGFYERMPNDKYTREDERGASTGVFIGLDDVEWEDMFHVDVQSLLKEVGAVRNDEGIYKL